MAAPTMLVRCSGSSPKRTARLSLLEKSNFSFVDSVRSPCLPGIAKEKVHHEGGANILLPRRCSCFPSKRGEQYAPEEKLARLSLARIIQEQG